MLNFRITINLWHLIQEAKTTTWPIEGISIQQILGKKEIPPHEKQAVLNYINTAFSDFYQTKNKFFFQDPHTCERDLINNILLSSSENLLFLFMSLNYEHDPNEAVTSADIFVRLLRWAREHKIPTRMLPGRQSIAGRLELLGYDRCPVGGAPGIYGIAPKI